MAIYSSVPPPSQQTPLVSAAAVDIKSWSASAVEALSISPSARGTGVTLSIPLDRNDETPTDTHRPRKELLRRDSMKRREELLKGKEGSRRRQRWENDRLLHVPNAQPPLPSDWEVRPTYPVHAVPYYLAPLWDAGVRLQAEEVAAAKKLVSAKKAGNGEQRGRIPAELKQKLKRSKGAKCLLQDLEEEIRKFVVDWERKQRVLNGGKGGSNVEGEIEGLEMDSEDEEIVFVGRNGMMSDEQRKTVEEELEREKLVFDSLLDDHGASFGRWLVHSIATYYGLSSRSITVGDPARREAYVSIKEMKTGRHLSVENGQLPRPLWGMI